MIHSKKISKLYQHVSSQDEGLDEIKTDIRLEKGVPHRHLRSIMEELIKSADKYIRMASSLTVGAGAGKSKLDKHRLKACKMHMVSLKLRNIDSYI